MLDLALTNKVLDRAGDILDRQPARTRYESREHVRRERVHSESGGVPLWRWASTGRQIHASVVDDRLHLSDRDDLIGDASGLGGAAQIANDDDLGRSSSEITEHRALTRTRVQTTW